MRSSILPLTRFSASGMSSTTMSPSSFEAAKSAHDEPTLPPPIIDIFGRLVMLSVPCS